MYLSSFLLQRGDRKQIFGQIQQIKKRTRTKRIKKVRKTCKISPDIKNIARGTTDPEIDSETWTELGNNMAPLALIANLATRWRHLTFSHLITFLTR